MVEVKNECRRSFRFAQPALKILFRSAASLKISRMYQGRVTNKAIILYLIAELECTSDVVRLDVLRKTLEIVVGRTPDDTGI